MHKTARNYHRFLLLGLAMGSLLVGLWSGWLKLGLPLPGFPTAWPLVHGPLMVGGFLGTLISLERAVALRQAWAYIVPALTGLGALAFVVLPLESVGPTLITLGSLGMVVLSLKILQRQHASFNVVMVLGTLTWLIGNVLWLWEWPLPQIVPWWMAFLVLTIAGERLEFSRLLRHGSRDKGAFMGCVVVLFLGLLGTTMVPDLGVRVFGLGLLALTVWLGLHDVATHTVKKQGLPRFVAVCLLSGYVWLGASGALAALNGYVVGGPAYDALLHTLFLGFVFSMIFGHAPLIFPGILRIAVPFHPRFYAHWALLHATVLLRVVGDLGGGGAAWRWGGLLNGVTVLLFLANTLGAAWQGWKWAKRSS